MQRVLQQLQCRIITHLRHTLYPAYHLSLIQSPTVYLTYHTIKFTTSAQGNYPPIQQTNPIFIHACKPQQSCYTRSPITHSFTHSHEAPALNPRTAFPLAKEIKRSRYRIQIANVHGRVYACIHDNTTPK